nr:immunoglobulin heavy chain junction region [Macaca mulatta]MOW94393.1 immunoglobulin heavy chain junction region [Macaca mulatta]MOW94557.1 immunoglobulin heavy chain junction region [Macaca mulatta]MOW95138.1 immunoglobulin heavy chain junction region [Macaca mulatta]MOW95427.1 immunoglobulin heavy chain junction region [Macaca mulatta]
CTRVMVTVPITPEEPIFFW